MYPLFFPKNYLLPPQVFLYYIYLIKFYNLSYIAASHIKLKIKID